MTDQMRVSGAANVRTVEDDTAGRWYRFDSPDEWTCGVRVQNCRVIAAGPRLHRIVGWEFGDALEFARECGWTVESVR